jgi:hypothetical protein
MGKRKLGDTMKLKGQIVVCVEQSESFLTGSRALKRFGDTENSDTVHPI